MSRNPTSIEDLFAEGLTHHRAGRLDRAERTYREVLRREPTAAGARQMLGVVFLQRDEPAQALEAFERAIALDPQSAEARINRANALRALGRVDAAIAAYHDAIERAPSTPAAYNGLGNGLLERGDVDGALRAFDRAAELDPQCFPAVANRALLLARSPDADPALKLDLLDDAVTLGEAKGESGYAFASCLLLRGRIRREIGRVDDAIDDLRGATELDPALGPAHLSLGRALAASGRYDDAIGPFEAAIASLEDPTEAFKALAVLFRRCDRPEDAAAVYARWLRYDPAAPVPTHMHAAFYQRDVPDRASDAYVRDEFDGFAETFETILTKLEYCGPQVVDRMLTRFAGQLPAHGAVLDAGCGTGWCGPQLRLRFEQLIGVDLSPKMLAHAEARDLYDALFEADLILFTQEQPEAFDCVVSADVLIYFGDLRAPLAGFARTLRPGGLLVATTEAIVEPGPQETYRLYADGRYQHAEAYIARTLAEVGLQTLCLEPQSVRAELRHPVPGWVFVARKPSFEP